MDCITFITLNKLNLPVNTRVHGISIIMELRQNSVTDFVDATASATPYFDALLTMASAAPVKAMATYALRPLKIDVLALSELDNPRLRSEYSDIFGSVSNYFK